MKPPLRTKSVGTKVSEAEFALLEERARGAGMRLAEWVRDPHARERSRHPVHPANPRPRGHQDDSDTPAKRKAQSKVAGMLKAGTGAK